MKPNGPLQGTCMVCKEDRGVQSRLWGPNVCLGCPYLRRTYRSPNSGCSELHATCFCSVVFVSSRELLGMNTTNVFSTLLPIRYRVHARLPLNCSTHS